MATTPANFVLKKAFKKACFFILNLAYYAGNWRQSQISDLVKLAPKIVAFLDTGWRGADRKLQDFSIR